MPKARPTGRIMNVGLHPHVIGQPHRIAALREFIEYVKGKSQVWFPTREQIATWYLAEGRRVGAALALRYPDAHPLAEP